MNRVTPHGRLRPHVLYATKENCMSMIHGRIVVFTTFNQDGLTRG